MPRQVVRAGKPAQAVGAGVRLLPRVGQHVRLQVSRQAEALPALLARVGPQVAVSPAVLAQVAGRRVAAVALGTLEGLLARVDPLVLDEVARLREALVALVALVGPLAGVRALVVPQVRQADEPLAADGAVVRPLARVGPQVDLQGAQVPGLQAAVAALVHLVARVGPGVDAQVLLGVEALAAGAAVEGLVAGVGPQVEREAGLEAKLLAALGAGVVLLAGVRGQVAAEVVLPVEGLAAHLALVRLLARVDLHVLPPAAALHEAPAAVPAHERPLAGVRAHVHLQALRRAQLLAALWALHARVQADGSVLGLGAVRLVAQVRALAPRGFEALAAVGAAEVAPAGRHRHAVPPLAVVLQVLQVLEAARARRAGVEPAGGRRGVGLAHVDPQEDLGLEAAAADGARVLGRQAEAAAGEAGSQLGQVLLLMHPLDVLLQEFHVGEGDVAVRAGEKIRVWRWVETRREQEMIIDAQRKYHPSIRNSCQTMRKHQIKHRKCQKHTFTRLIPFES